MSSRDYAQGIGTGIVIAAVLVHVWLAVELRHMQAMYADFTAPLPMLTRLTISVPWRWGVPLVGAVGVFGLVVGRPRATWIYGLVAAVLVATCLGTWYFAQAPVFENVGEIK